MLFLPHHFSSALWILFIVIIQFISGYFLYAGLNIKTGRIAAWAALILSMTGVQLLIADQPAGFRMLAFILVLFQSAKNICLVEFKRGKLNFWQWALFSFTWFGMDPQFLLRRQERSIPYWKQDLFTGVSRIFAGIALVFALRISVEIWFGTVFQPVAGLILLVGLSLFLHFGVLRVSTALYRKAGYSAKVLFRQPVKSRSLREFWSRRWNIAFVEMTSAIVYRPLKGEIGKPRALLLAFLFSGVLHEIAISLPVQTCFGLPMIYFILQLTGIYLEEKLFNRPPGILWVCIFLVAPLPVLFHPPFMQEVLWPIVLS